MPGFQRRRAGGGPGGSFRPLDTLSTSTAFRASLPALVRSPLALVPLTAMAGLEAMRCAMLGGGRAWNRGNAFANQNR